MGLFFEVLVGDVVMGERNPDCRIPTERPEVISRFFSNCSQDWIGSNNAQFLNIDLRNDTLQLYGGDSTLSPNTTVRISAAVVRGEPGPGGGGAGFTRSQIQDLIDMNPAFEPSGNGHGRPDTRRHHA